MVNRIQTLRSSVAGNVPATGTRQPGELWVNFADKQIGYIDASQIAQKTQAVRFFSTLSTYASGDCVWNAGSLYAANTAVSPGAFNPSQWTLIGGALVGYLPIGGGTLTGGLTLSAGNLSVSAGNISASGSATFGSIITTGNLSAAGAGTTSTFNDIKTATLEATGALTAYSLATTGGGISAQTTITAGNGIINNGANGIQSNGGQFIAKGNLAAFMTYDRGDSGGTTSQAFGMYRDGNIGYLYMDPIGNALTVSNAGLGTWTHGWSVSGQLIVYGTSTLTGAVSINSAANWPIQITANASVYPAVLTQTSGQHQWVCGAWPDSTFYIFDNSNGKTGLCVDATGNFIPSNNNGSQITTGATGMWDTAGKMVMSPAGSGAGAGGAISCYGSVALSTNLKSRVDVTNAYLMYSMYGGGAVGWVTTDGGTTYYSGACDGRLKENVRSLASEVDVGGIIDRLNPVAFEWLPRSFTTPDQVELSEGVTIDENSPPDLLEKAKRVTPGKEIRFDGHTSYGFVAQELYEIVPHLVQKPIEPEEGRERPEGVGDIWGADITHLVPYLVAELQALRKRVAQLEGAA